MANHKQAAHKRKPISSHRLFPTVVSLWCGALFGLGTLAVRADLLDAFILRSDVLRIVPAATLPLGLPARIAVAAGMAALGILVGIALGRRLARPQHAARGEPQDTRPSAASEPAGPSAHPQSQAERGEPSAAPAPAPVVPGAPGDRRRELTPRASEPPQILDITGMDLGEPITEPIAAGETADGAEAAGEQVLPVLAEPETLAPTPTRPVAPRQVFGMAGEDFAAPPSHLLPVATPGGDDWPRPLAQEPASPTAPGYAPAHQRLYAARPPIAPRETAPPPADMPAAMRPIALDAADECAADDNEFVASLMPPRLPAGLAATPLDRFVRIEEPAAPDEPSEPVVIFPGQSAMAAAEAVRQIARLTTGSTAARAQHGNAAISEDHDVPASTLRERPLTDPAEIERALRAALVNLQRLGGMV